jgi:hypothetical protein
VQLVCYVLSRHLFVMNPQSSQSKLHWNMKLLMYYASHTFPLNTVNHWWTERLPSNERAEDIDCFAPQDVPFKTQLNNSHVLRYRNEVTSRSTPVKYSLPTSPVTLESRSRQLRRSCAGANMVYSRAERVFILKHYFVPKSFAAVREAFSNAYPDKEHRIRQQYTDW